MTSQKILTININEKIITRLLDYSVHWLGISNIHNSRYRRRTIFGHVRTQSLYKYTYPFKTLYRREKVTGLERRAWVCICRISHISNKRCLYVVKYTSDKRSSRVQDGTCIILTFIIRISPTSFVRRRKYVLYTSKLGRKLTGTGNLIFTF